MRVRFRAKRPPRFRYVKGYAKRRQGPPWIQVALSFVVVAAVVVLWMALEDETPAPAVSPVSDPAAGIATEPKTPESTVPTITYTGEGGFVPKRLDVEPGARVRFVNSSDEEFWPASNIHPTHLILPELDAGKAIPRGELWTFTFEEQGYWRFHNHLAPEFGGLVAVRGQDAAPASEPLVLTYPEVPFETPADIREEDYVALVSDDALLSAFIERYGPMHTVRLLKESESYVDEDCHQRAHHLGRAAYEAFGPAAFALSGHECHAGAFHGATESLFSSRGTANLEQDVATMCAGAANPFFRHQCVHGVGHGLMAWTSYELHDALRLCDRMPTESDKGSCYSGVFMENVVGGLTGLMGHVTEYLRDDDPHYPCDIVGERYQAPCYFFQTSHMLEVFDRDFSRVAQACAETPPAAHQSCFQSYGRDVGGATRKDPASAIVHCSHAPAGPNRVDCIRGAVQDRFWDKSGAGDALAMCAMIEDAAEQDACYRTIVLRARDIFTTREETDGFCAEVGERWREWCADVLAATG